MWRGRTRGDVRTCTAGVPDITVREQQVHYRLKTSMKTF